MNQTFTKLASDFDEALQHYRDCEEAVAHATSTLRRMEAERDNSAEAMRTARDNLLKAYPELAPTGANVTPNPNAEWQPPGPGAFTPIEVDDPDDVPDFRERP